MGRPVMTLAPARHRLLAQPERINALVATAATCTQTYFLAFPKSGLPAIKRAVGYNTKIERKIMFFSENQAYKTMGTLIVFITKVQCRFENV